MEKSRPQSPKWTRALLATVLFVLYLPMLIMILYSFIDQGAPTLKWYSEIFQDQVLTEALQRSLLIGFGSAFVATLIGSLAAIALFKSDFVGKKILQFLATAALILPELVFALALLSWFFILKFPLSLTTVWLSHITFSLSFVILIVTARLASLDLSIEDAARDLGASEVAILVKILLPLLKPALGVSFALCFLLSFDDFLITYFVSGVGADTLPIKLYTAMKMGHSPKLNALSTLMILISAVMIYLLLKFHGQSQPNPKMGKTKS